ncbi:MAG: uroporphyrinogen-III C-methyltransferase [Rubrivivax sp.]|nr:uroporphyrinogen-III C-methyltransferase [Rubrivivax sp.]
MSDSPVTPSAAAPAAPAATPAAPSSGRWLALGGAVMAALLAAALLLAWNTQQRVKALEHELVKRQQDSGSVASEARMLARQADEVARESAARLALLDARVTESVVQRSQLEELIQSLARSRDENVLADVDAALRVALQQTAITGSAEPLVAALRQADERLARYNQPRLEQVRRAVGKDLERTRAAGVADLSVLAIRIDEAIRQIDDLPLLSAPETKAAARAAAAPAKAASAAAAASAAQAAPGWLPQWSGPWRDFAGHLWQEVRSLVRVNRIDQPEAMLVAPEQAYFLRENVKLRLLNARLALLSRQFDIAQSDLRDAQSALDRYFDRQSRRVQTTSDLVRLVSKQARLVSVPWPDATLAAIATASAGR